MVAGEFHMANLSSKALIRVDIQNDFLANSSVAIARAQEIIPNVNELSCNSFFKLVVDIRDCHKPTHKSFAKWGQHCIEGSYGYNPPSTLYVNSNIKLFHKGMDDKVDTLSGFENPELLPYLLAQKIQSIYIVGLALDFCVLSTAIDAVKYNFATYIILDACKGINVNMDNLTFQKKLASQGIKTLKTADILSLK